MTAPPPRPAAVQISDPSTLSVATNRSGRETEDKQKRLCRNVLVYGSCKYENQGCPFVHPSSNTSNTNDSLSIANTSKSFTPSSKQSKSSTRTSELSAEHLFAPVFVPKASKDVTSRTGTPATGVELHGQVHTPTTQGWSMSTGGGLMSQPSGPSPAPRPHDMYEPNMFDPGQTMEGSMYLPTSTRTIPLDQHLYTSPLPHVANPPLSQNPMHAFFIPDDIRRMVQARQTATYARPPREISLKLPDEVSSYHNLIPIGLAMPPRSQVYGFPSPIYKAISSVDGNIYALRRIAGYKVTSEQAFSTVERWQRLRHPNVVCLREAFTTKVFDDDSLVMVYDYHPESNTMYDEHLASDMTNRFIPIFPRRRTGMPIPERLLWSYMTQIANALKAIHVSNLAARVLDPSKILITGKNRIRLNACGVVDVIGQEQGVSLAQQQEEDLVMFGMLILTLACEFFTPGVPLAAPLDWIARHYTADFKLFISALVNRQLRHIDEVIREIGPRILNELDASFRYNDQLESDLGGEVENGRLVRLMTKLSFVNERKEFERDPRWSETGDRYILKLFRDHVFHSTGTDGTPVLDLSHVLTCLNKLDAGTEERVMLVSRDEQSCLVVSYRELKACVEGTYNELRLASSIISNPTLVSNTPLRR